MIKVFLIYYIQSDLKIKINSKECAQNWDSINFCAKTKWLGLCEAVIKHIYETMEFNLKGVPWRIILNLPCSFMETEVNWLASVWIWISLNPYLIFYTLKKIKCNLLNTS